MKNGNDGFKKKTQQVINEDTFSLTPVLELPASGHPSYAAKVKTFEGKGIAVSSTSVILRPSSPRDRISDLLSKDLPTLPPPPPPRKKLIVTKEQEMKGKGTDHRESYAGRGAGEYDPFFSTLHPTDRPRATLCADSQTTSSSPSKRSCSKWLLLHAHTQLFTFPLITQASHAQWLIDV